MNVDTVTALTSINPRGRIAHQLRCFAAWRQLGVNILTANVPDEAAQLRALGVAPEHILEISPGETGQSIHRIPSPRILPILYRLLDAAAGGGAMLVNADLFPATDTTEVFDAWHAASSAVGLTREECPSVDAHDPNRLAPYRGGVDAFIFGSAALESIVAELRKCDAVERMAFGIPGWDFLMVAVLTAPCVGGTILDSGLLLHESHPTTYATIEELSHYLPDVSRLAGRTYSDTTEAAAAVAARIAACCIGNEPQTRVWRQAYYMPPERIEPSAQDIAIAVRLCDLSPSLAWWLKGPAIAQFAARVRREGPPTFARAQFLFEVNPDNDYRFTQRLQTILFCLMCRDHPDRFPLTQAYPPNNLHSRTVAMIRANLQPENALLRCEFAALFGSELLDHGIFNPRIFNVLVGFAETGEERALLAEILANIRKHAHAA